MHLGCFCKKNYCQELLKNRPIWSHWVTGGERRSQYICKRNYSLTLAVVVTFVVVVAAAVVAVVFVVLLYNVVTLPNLKLLQSHYFVVCSAFSFVIRDFQKICLHRPLFCLFLVFFKQTWMQFLQKINVKKCSSRIFEFRPSEHEPLP